MGDEKALAKGGGDTPPGGRSRNASASAVVAKGTVLGRYRVEECLGRGGMGRVYRAEGPDGPCAIKLVHPQFLSQPEFLRRFRMEAGAGARIRHENVVRTFGVETVHVGAQEQAILVMEYVKGRTLADHLKEVRAMPEALLRDVGAGIARGLEAIHAAGVIHRDLKPENVMITEDQRVKIMDLGVARMRSEEIRLSRTGHFVGSLMFAAPEQLAENGAHCGPAADLYGVGLLLYMMATGRHPFATGSVGEIINAHLNSVPKPLRALAPLVSPFLETLVATLLEKEASRRLPSATALRETLESGESSEWWIRRRPAAAGTEGSASRRPRVRRQGPVRGRPAELRTLGDAWRRVTAGQGRVVLVTGEAGIGKSRLLDGFLDGVAPEPETAGVGVATPEDRDLPFGAFRQALLGLLPESGRPRALEEALGGASALAPALLAFLGDGTVPQGSGTLRPLLVQAVLGLAARRPRLVVVEDLDRVSATDLEAFRALAKAAGGTSLLLVGTARPTLSAEVREEVLGLPGAVELAVKRLDEANAQRILADLVGSRTLAGRLAHEVLPRAGGNPLFLSEIVEGFKESRVLAPAPGGTWRLAGGSPGAAVPASLSDLLGRRLDVLPAEAVEVLEAGAVQGTAFDARVAAAALGRPAAEVLERLVALGRDPALLRGEGDVREFEPALVRDVLLARMPESRRRALHRRTAEETEARARARGPEAVASSLPIVVTHYLRGDAVERAAALLPQALERLALGFRHAEALDLTAEALERAPDLEPDLLLAVMVRRSRLLQAMGRREEERRCLEQVLGLASKLGLAVPPEALDAHGRLLLLDGDAARASDLFRRQLEAACDAKDRAAEARALRNLGEVAARRGDAKEARRLQEKSLVLSRATRDATGELAALGALATLFESEGRPERARAHGIRRLDLAGRLGNLPEAAAAHDGLARLAQRGGRFREAQVHLDRQLQIARETGDTGAECRALQGLGRLHVARGRLEPAQRVLAQGLAAAHDAGREGDEASLSVDLCRLSLLTGDPVGMMRHALRALSMAQRLKEPGLECAALTLAGLAAEERDDVEEAMDWYQQALSRRRGLPRAGGDVAPLLGLARAWRSRGRPDRAAEPLARAAEAARRASLPGPLVIAEALRAATLETSPGEVLALLAREGDRLAFHERLEAHLELAAATGDPLHGDEARLLFDVLTQDMAPEAREAMAKGFSLYRRLPAPTPARAGEAPR
jgi:tetratricopeptide (TPR) repeat protein/tRNA A-37 threonylcarbamoyl transferase component Bud32